MLERQASDSGPVPARAGIGLRTPHVKELLARRPVVPWLEVHSENYFAPGGRAVAELDEVRRHYPLSLHGVGLSLGSADPLDEEHLRRLSQAVARFEPMLISEHLCWTSVGGSHFHDLLPLPYTEEALDHVTARIATVQEHLGRRMLIENVSSYIEFEHSAIPEWEFLKEVAARSSCGILLDVNNIHVSAVNHGFDAYAYVDAIPTRDVGEIHLAGHTRRELDQGVILIDSHDQPVDDAVWSLYDHALARLGPKPTLIEWDSSLPSLDGLLAEATKAQSHLERRHAAAA